MLADQGDALGGGCIASMLNADDLRISNAHNLRQFLLGLSMFFPLFQNTLAKKFFRKHRNTS